MVFQIASLWNYNGIMEYNKIPAKKQRLTWNVTNLLLPSSDIKSPTIKPTSLSSLPFELRIRKLKSSGNGFWDVMATLYFEFILNSLDPVIVKVLKIQKNWINYSFYLIIRSFISKIITHWTCHKCRILIKRKKSLESSLTSNSI